jgi:hypothetical protein
MAKEDIPVFREAQRGQAVRSADWNTIQRELRHSIRTHKHSQVVGEPLDDATDRDNALQITTEEIATGAVGVAKLNPDVRGRLDGAAQVRTGVVTVGGGGIEQIEHTLGAVPVAIMLGIMRELEEPTGKFEIYGLDPGQDGEAIFAAAPAEPDGTFFVISRSARALDVRWWAFAQTTGAAIS